MKNMTESYQHSPFLTDFYEFTMAYAYFKQGRHEDVAYFDMFVRTLPDQGGYMIFNGLNQLIEHITNFRFSEHDLSRLKQRLNCDDAFINYLREMRLSLDIWSMEEGTVVFNNEPLVTVRGPLIQTQLIESMLLLSINFPTLISTKARRMVEAAQGRDIIEFGIRRAQGIDAAVEGARAAYIAGCIGTSNMYAGDKYSIPVFGTMAHSYIQLFKSEYDAFKAYTTLYPDQAVLLVDTYDTLRSGVPNAIRVANEVLKPLNKNLRGIRLDSGDLAYLSKKARDLLNAAGLKDVKIVASNALDENLIDDLIDQDACIDIFGVGENLITARSQAVLGGVYKLVAYEENDRLTSTIKLSENIDKITNPGFKKVVRFYDKDHRKALGDCLFMHDEEVPTDGFILFDPLAPWKTKQLNNYTTRVLQVPIFRQGELVYSIKSTEETRLYCLNEIDTLWDEVKRLRNPHKYYVDLSPTLYELKNSLIENIRKK
jgi:nicotinate phosphoribosyltransferase